MGRLTVLALRIVPATALAGSLFSQAAILALLAFAPGDAGADTIRVPVPLIVIAKRGRRQRPHAPNGAK